MRCAASAVSALAIGEHGESVFFDTARVHGKHSDFSRAAKQEIRDGTELVPAISGGLYAFFRLDIGKILPP